MAFQLLISGARACFRRVEFSEQFVTYDVITPMAARAVFEAVHWTPSIAWQIDEIRVLRPINLVWESLEASKNIQSGGIDEGEAGAAPCGNMANMLTDVAYIVTAHFDLVAGAVPEESAGQHSAIFRRRLKQGRFFRQPFLGLSALPARVEEIAKGAAMPDPIPELRGSIDLGWMVFDTHVAGHAGARFFRAVMVDGVIDLRERTSLMLAG